MIIETILVMRGTQTWTYITDHDHTMKSIKEWHISSSIATTFAKLNKYNTRQDTQYDEESQKIKITTHHSMIDMRKRCTHKANMSEKWKFKHQMYEHEPKALK